MAILVLCTVLPLLLSLAWKPAIRFVWNASPSAPVGLYYLSPGAPVRRGDMVVAWTPGRARMLAAERRYLPRNVPLVKRVAAVAGDRICGLGGILSINGRRLAARQRTDPAGRPMPAWQGCRRLRRPEYLLLMDSPSSFDGRYFGPTRRSEILGRAHLVWAGGANRG
ncbi:MAG TPA: S26 family signal peptidase [Sphingomicrobium sp.]